MAKTEAPPPGSSMTKWRVGKDRKDGSITVEMTFSDPAEARAWSTFVRNP